MASTNEAAISVKETLKGAPHEVSVDDPYIQEMANAALTEVDRRSNAAYRQKIVRIVSARKQVVAGTLVTLTLELGSTSSRKGADGDINDCQLKEDSNNQLCHVKIWDRPWLNLREVTSVSYGSASENTATDSASETKRVGQ